MHMFKVHNVKPAKPNTYGILANVHFEYDIIPTVEGPVVLTESWKDKDEVWHESEALKIVSVYGSQLRVIVFAALLKTSRKGDPYIQVKGLKLPAEVASGVAENAMRLLSTQLAHSSNAENGDPFPHHAPSAANGTAPVPIYPF